MTTAISSCKYVFLIFRGYHREIFILLLCRGYHRDFFVSAIVTAIFKNTIETDTEFMYNHFGTKKEAGIVMTGKIYSVSEIRDIVNPIASRYGIERMYLFGSYARGEAKAESDIDLRVDTGKLHGLFALGGLYTDLEERFGKKLDLLTTRSLDRRFLDSIAKEEILIYES